MDSKRLTPEGIYNSMRERHKQNMIRDKFISPFYIRRELERKYPDIDIGKYISELKSEIANEQNNNAL